MEQTSLFGTAPFRNSLTKMNAVRTSDSSRCSTPDKHIWTRVRRECRSSISSSSSSSSRSSSNSSQTQNSFTSYSQNYSDLIRTFKTRWKVLVHRMLLSRYRLWRAECLVTGVFVFLVLVPNAVLSQVSSNSFGVWENEVSMDENRRFVVQWSPSEDRILFRITARTRGYVGFGFHSRPQMKGADIVVGWVHSGKIYLQDRHGRGNEAPYVDRQQDWDLIGGFENDTHTVLTMSRPYITCDQNDHPITNDTIRLLWAYHPDDPVDPESPRPRLHYHGISRRGVTTIFLLQRASEALPKRPLHLNRPKLHFHQDVFEASDPHLHSWSLVGPTATIEPSVDSVDSIHWCRLFKRPQISRKHHVVRYEPVVTGEGAAEVHHMMVYECVRLGEENEAFFSDLADTEGSNCSVSNMKTLMSACNHVVVAWALGSEGVWLPPEAGYPLTPEGPIFYMLETHYNMSRKTPLKDASGVRLLYTPFLRNYDAGVLSVGLHPNWKHIIPPRQVSVLSEGHCVSDCTHAIFPSTGINIFGVIFHTHLLGRKVRLRHLRDDVEFEPIASDSNYDFTYQEYRALRNTRTVLPGDHLIGECVYDSQKCSSITLGGFKTREEMCLSYVFYYPKVPLSICHSKPSLGTVLQSLGIEELSYKSKPITIRLPLELAGKTLKWRLQNYDWENQFEHFQRATHAGTFNAMCRGHDLAPLLEQDYSYPNVSKEWGRQSPCEREQSKSRRKKKKGDSEGPSRSHFERESAAHQPEDGELMEDDAMVDDETSLKLIERIDVDPVSSFDVFMPVIGGDGDFKGVETANFGGGAPGPNAPQQEDSGSNSLLEEFEQIEKELETEIHTKRVPPEVLHKQETHKEAVARAPASYSVDVALFILGISWSLFAHRRLPLRPG